MRKFPSWVSSVYFDLRSTLKFFIAIPTHKIARPIFISLPKNWNPQASPAFLSGILSENSKFAFLKKQSMLWHLWLANYKMCFTRELACTAQWYSRSPIPVFTHYEWHDTSMYPLCRNWIFWLKNLWKIFLTTKVGSWP